MSYRVLLPEASCESLEWGLYPFISQNLQLRRVTGEYFIGVLIYSTVSRRLSAILRR